MGQYFYPIKGIQSSIASGWTTVLPVGTVQTPSQNGPGSRQIYVSSSGSDSNLGTIASPFATAAHGATFIRTGKSDQLLFKCGDTFTGDFICDSGTGLFAQQGVAPTIIAGNYITGATISGPILIGSYGVGPRPIFRFPIGFGPNGRQGSFMSCQNTTDGNNVVIQGLNFYAYTRDPANGAYVGAATAAADSNTVPLWYALGGTNVWPAMLVLLEDNVFNYFCLGGIDFQGSDNGLIPRLNPVTFVTRRNIFINQYNGSSSNHSQGIFTHGVQNFYDIENFFDHNGWSEDAGLISQTPGTGATIFNRNIYDGNEGISVQGTLIRVAQGSIHARGSSNTQWRAGCNVSDCLFLNNGVGGFDIGENFSTAGTDCHVSQLYLVQRNVILQSVGIATTNADPGHPGGSGIFLNNISNAAVQNNIVAQCDTSSTSSISVNWVPTGDGTVSGNFVTNHITSKINTAYTSVSQPTQVDVSSGTNTVDLTGGSGPNPTSSSFVGDYWSKQPGGSSNYTDFLAACAARAGGTWPRNLTAYAVNDYVQTQFGVGYRS